MRPSKPGSYWWMDINGKYRTVEFDDEMYTPVQTGGFLMFLLQNFNFLIHMVLRKKMILNVGSVQLIHRRGLKLDTNLLLGHGHSPVGR